MLQEESLLSTAFERSIKKKSGVQSTQRIKATIV